MKPSRRERRRRPLRRGQIAAIRVIYLLGGTFCAVVWSLGMPASSSWRVEALAVAISLIGGLAGFSTQHIRQLLGMRRPPGDRARQR